MGKIQPTSKDLAYDRISETWDEFISSYDTSRRIEVLVEDFLGQKQITGKKCLDAGCGLGYFTQALLEHKPSYICACDISSKLVEKLSSRLPDVECVVANILELSTTFQGKTFDVVVCSDVIEHTPDPELATKQLTQMVAPGGLLSISVPNQRWRWLLGLAQTLGLRDQYEGYENWVRPKELKDWIETERFEIIRLEGIHTIPFKLFPHALLRKMDHGLCEAIHHHLSGMIMTTLHRDSPTLPL